MVVLPLPPGCLSTVWGDDARFVKPISPISISRCIPASTGRGAMPMATIHPWRADDVINVAGHRLGTREIEEALSSNAWWRKLRWLAPPMS